MQLLSVQLARSTWFFDIAETNPRGKNIFLDLVPSLVEEFEFKVVPQENGDFKDGIKFTSGTFTNSRGDHLQVSLTIWSDGVGADVFSTTTDADEFLKQACDLMPGLGYTFEPGMVRKKLFLSQIFVQCEKLLNSLSPGLKSFSRKLSEAVGGPKFDACALEFWPDQTQAFKPTSFSFQRRSGDSFSDARYWSQAALPTDKHLDLLGELEKLLS